VVRTQRRSYTLRSLVVDELQPIDEERALATAPVLWTRRFESDADAVAQATADMARRYRPAGRDVELFALLVSGPGGPEVLSLPDLAVVAGGASRRRLARPQRRIERIEAGERTTVRRARRPSTGGPGPVSIASGRSLDSGYFSSSREDVLAVVPDAPSYLEVGCGTGAFGSSLRRRHPDAEMWGIELVPEAAEEAEQVFDRVVVGPFPDVADQLDRTFECVVCNDVLEHMVDPWRALDRIVELVEPGGAVVASIPNVRNLQTITQLLRGRWDYVPSGVLDRTHLRFFTKATMIELFEGAGLRVEQIVGSFSLGTNRLAALRLTSWPILHRLLYRQYILVGRPT
jgi:2-polyprenyl-3-methyl-5-hydroxy-6-metoxy-1,4-benzoquinol methylase